MSSAHWLRPVIQMTDTSIVLGFALCPQILRPFLGRINHETDITNNKIASVMSGDGLQPIQVAFLIVSALDIFMIIACTSMFVWSSIRSGRGCGVGLCIIATGDNDDMQLIPDDQLSNDEGKVEHCSRWGCILLLVLYLLFLTYGGIDLLFLSLLYTYLYEYVGWSVEASTLLATLCQLSSFVFGTMMVVASLWISPFKLMIFNMVMWFISSVMLWLSLVGGDTFIVIGVLSGTGIACNMYPTTFTLVEEKMHVIAPVMALFITTIGLGDMILGPIAGALLHNVGMVAFPSLLFTLFLTATVLFIVYTVLTSVNSTDA